MVREARFLSDDPGWVDPSRFVDDRDGGEADLELPAARRNAGRGRRRRPTRDIHSGSNPRRRPQDKHQAGDK